MNWWRKRGLSFKIALGVSLTLLVVLGAVFTVVVLRVKDYLYDREVQSAGRMNKLFLTMIGNEMLTNNWDLVATGAESFSQDPEDQLSSIAIFTRRTDSGDIAYNRILMAVYATGFPGGRQVPRRVLEKETYSKECNDCHQLAPAQRKPVADAVVEYRTLTETASFPVLRSAIAIRNEEPCQACHGTERSVLGMSLIDFRLDRYHDSFNLARNQLLAGGGLAVVVSVVALGLLINGVVLRPLGDILASTQAVAEGEWDRQVRIRSGDEVGRLGESFNRMTAELNSTYTKLQQTSQESKLQAESLQQALNEIEQGHEEQIRLVQTIQQMVVPVVPVHRGVLVTPLVGLIDEGRAQRIIEALLTTVEKERARVVILDITGVPMVDTAVAQTLLQAAMAVRLLGAEAILVGVSPQVAETIISLGVDLTGLVTRADLQSGVEYALKRQK